jgi:hypothetical protein
MKHFREIIAFLLLLSTIVSLAQTRSEFWSYTNDYIIIDGSQYLANKSPLAFFQGYTQLYKGGRCHTSYATPQRQDKYYYVEWSILNNKLYACGIKDGCFDKYLMVDSLEFLVNAKFSNELIPDSLKNNPRFDRGFLPAEWFSDTLYLKRYPKYEDGESSGDDSYINENFLKLVFDKGNLVKTDTVSEMNYSFKDRKNEDTGHLISGNN